MRLSQYASACMREAFHKSISTANAWSYPFGAAVIYGLARITGQPIILPTGWRGVGITAIACLVVTWVFFFAVWCVFWAPYHLAVKADTTIADLQNKVSALEAKLAPAMRLEFDESALGIAWEEGKPLRQVVCLRVRNTGGRTLSDCQVLVRLSSDIEGFVWANKRIRFPVCALFYLRIGEEESVGMASLNFDEPQSPIRFTVFRQVSGYWSEFPDSIKIPPVDFDAHVSCISTDSQPAHIRIEFRHHVDRWRIKVADGV